MIRRFGNSVRADVRYQHRPGVYAVLLRDGQALVTLQSDPYPEYQLPGGGIDPGESTVRALHREVWEETGWRIAHPRRLGVFRRFTFMPVYNIWAEKLCNIYVAQPVLQLTEPKEPAHCAVWMDPASAAQHLGNAGDRHFMHLAARV